MQWLKVGGTKSRPVGVDRDAKILRGYVVVQQGPIKDGRGEFDAEGLQQTADLINASASGVKSRFTHPSLSSDGLGKFLGRAKNASVGDGQVRADLHFAESAFNTPSGDLAGYVMDLAEEDSDALSSSIVVKPKEVYRTTKDGKREVGENGQSLPPLWYPQKILASDIVDEGAAVDGLLAAGIDVDELPDAVLYAASELLNRQFPKMDREELHAKAEAFLRRYLDNRYGVEKVPQPDPFKLRARIYQNDIDT
jgi:hypothetical protein